MNLATAVMVCGLALMPAAAWCQQESTPQAVPDAPSGRRIVDPKKFPPKSPLPARILLAPFRAIGPALDRGLTYAEDTKLLTRLRKWFTHPHARPLFGSVTDGSGWGPGVELSTAEAISPNFKLVGSSLGTFKEYVQAKAGLRADPFGQGFRFFELDLIGRYHDFPQEDFWGIGPHSLQADRSTYELKQSGLAVTAAVRPVGGLRFGVGVDYSSNRVDPGEDQRYPTTQEQFAAAPPPALQGAQLFGPLAFVELDTRDAANNPRRGSFVSFAVSSLDDAGGDDFAFVSWRVDSRGYIPLGTKRRVLALRLLGEFNDPKGGSEVPFFRLARLGSTSTLRGYDSFRFQDRHVLTSSIEYRYQLVSAIDWVWFTDIGQVFRRRSELSLNNVHVTAGGGLQFKTRDSVVFKMLVGKSGEGARVFFNFGPTF